MSDDNKPLAIVVKEIVSVMRRGGGILGKSAGLMALLVICVGIALVRVAPTQILTVLLVGAGIVFVWFFPILWLVNKFPEKAMLEGPDWAQHQERIWLASKNHPVISTDSSQELTSAAITTIPLSKDQAERKEKGQ
jgi:hypothetical protein